MMDAWLDPRPLPSVSRPAIRPAGGKQRRLVFFDNGKLGPPYDRWMPIVEPLLETLRDMGSVQREAVDLLVEAVASYGPRVSQWKKDGVDGIVFGLCDAGVTQPTLVQAAAAEAAGIPTVVLCTGQVIDLAAASASFLMPGLPLIELPISRLDSDSALVQAARSVGGALREALTAGVAALQSRAVEKFPFTARLARSVDSAAAQAEDFADYARLNHMSDGFPLLAPTQARVRSLIDFCGRHADDVLIANMSPSGAALTVQGAAICSAMAGCTPGRFPLVLAALRAMGKPAHAPR